MKETVKLPKFVVGQKIYIVNYSFLAHFWEHEKVYETTVAKVGRKYITTDFLDLQFFIENGEAKEHNCDYIMLPNMESVYERWERGYLLKNIDTRGIYARKIPLDILREIARLLEIKAYERKPL